MATEIDVTPEPTPRAEVLRLLDVHYAAFQAALPAANQTKHPVPCDTRAWSQVLISLLTGIPGIARRKGPDLADGSDVKAANAWEAIDRPRFNGCAPAGRVLNNVEDVTALDGVPFLFFVLWDHDDQSQPRCRIWCVRSAADPIYRQLCANWYGGSRRSGNLQLHPPINSSSNIVRNTCGNLEVPLLYCAVRRAEHFEEVVYDPSVMASGLCQLV